MAIRTPKAFTIIEVMVSCAVLTLILMITVSIVGSTSTAYNQTRARAETFEEARASFEAITRKVSQAMLNTYWDYEYPNNDRTRPPRSYLRQSELHFVSGPTKAGSNPLIPSSEIQSVTHGIFFQAPQGFSAPPAGTPATAKLNNLLNSTGFYLSYGTDKYDRPEFLDRVAPENFRFRLMEFSQPTEYLSVFESVARANATGETARLLDWFREPLKFAHQEPPRTEPPPASWVRAKNVIALVIHPHRSPHDPSPPGSPGQLAPDYYYDSRRYQAAGAASDPLAKLTRNQLPPLVQVTMVCLDETSARRLVGRQPDPSVFPAELGLEDLFLAPSRNPEARTPVQVGDQYRDDLKKLEATLVEARLGYRVFNTEVSILQAKWSED